MAELRRIVTSSFLMLQVLSSTAASVEDSFFTVRAGDEVTLPCGNVTPDQNECNRITWLFIGSGKTEILFEYGKIHKEAEYKSDRLSVSENCSLVIKKVSDEDGGRYDCREFRTGTQEHAVVHLSVVTMSELKNPDEVTFICSVVTFSDRCNHRVKWMNEGKENDVVTSQRLCSAWLTIKKSHVDQKSYELLKCEVTDYYSGRVHQFPFSPTPSSALPSSDWTRSIVVVLGLAALIMSVVTVNIWTRTKVNKRLMEEVTERHEEEEEEEKEEEEEDGIYDDIREASASVSLD